MFLVGFGIMHLGWYNLQRNNTLNKALAASREKETLMVSWLEKTCIFISCTCWKDLLEDLWIIDF